ncbi:hypothetical protein F7725_002909 [Dissostichus mawsoni]|uniref:MADF domain-containing protein n=1 Tax=Dissostichus mawsoni TaxID=36200 RepID=A0A7J5YA27_DISMA|nr:hypothetical protein F7725_002909 [Dissostichus mawsoni]
MADRKESGKGFCGQLLLWQEKELKTKWDSLRTQYTQYTRYRTLAPSGSSGTLKTGRQQWILTRLQFLEPYTRRKESTSNLTITVTIYLNSGGCRITPGGTSSETWTSTPEEPFLLMLSQGPALPWQNPPSVEQSPHRHRHHSERGQAHSVT